MSARIVPESQIFDKETHRFSITTIPAGVDSFGCPPILIYVQGNQAEVFQWVVSVLNNHFSAVNLDNERSKK